MRAGALTDLREEAADYDWTAPSQVPPVAPPVEPVEPLEHTPVQLPQVLKVERGPAGETVQLTVDGAPFPYAVADIHVAMSGHGAPGVTVTLLARSVQVVDDFLRGVDVEVH